MIELDRDFPDPPKPKKRLPVRLNQHESRTRLHTTVNNQNPVKEVILDRTPEEWRGILDEAKRGARNV